MAHKDNQWKIVHTNWRVIATKKVKHVTIVGDSFYFMWPKSMNLPLFVWYIIEDRGDKVFAWVMKPWTWENKECEVRKAIITYDRKNDYKTDRQNYSSTYLPFAEVQNKKG